MNNQEIMLGSESELRGNSEFWSLPMPLVLGSLLGSPIFLGLHGINPYGFISNGYCFLILIIQYLVLRKFYTFRFFENGILIRYPFRLKERKRVIHFSELLAVEHDRDKYPYGFDEIYATIMLTLKSKDQFKLYVKKSEKRINSVFTFLENTSFNIYLVNR